MYLFVDDTTEFLAFIGGARSHRFLRSTWHEINASNPLFISWWRCSEWFALTKLSRHHQRHLLLDLLILSLLTWSLLVHRCQTDIFMLQSTSCTCYRAGNDSTPPPSPRSWWRFTYENLLSLVWLVACDMGCSTMVKLIKWFWWSGTSTKRLVWLQMSPNVQQIAKAVVEGKWSQRTESEVSGNTLAKCRDCSPLKSV